MLILHRINISNNLNQKINKSKEKQNLNTKRTEKVTKNKLNQNKILSFIYKSNLEKRSNTINLKGINHSNNLLLSKETFASKSSIFIKENKTKKENENARRLITFLKFKCFICDNVFITLYSTNFCQHKFCKICGRNYYEELIELGIFDSKCPKFFCDKHLDLKIIKLLISPFYFQRINSNSLTKNNINLNNNLIIYNDNTNNKYLIEEKYDKYLFNKNICEFTEKPKDIIKDYLKVKNLLCPKCGKPSLFGRNSNIYIKCLNCSFQLCKYCFKEYSDEHLNQRSPNYCKIFFRNLFGIKKGKKYDLGFFIICFIFGYLVFLIGFAKWLTSFFVNERKHFFIFTFIFIFSFIFSFFITILIFPYYPLITYIFEYF